MKRTESECVCCGFPCRRNGCRNYRVTRFYCDRCGEELGKIYDVDGEELCEECLKDMFRRNEN